MDVPRRKRFVREIPPGYVGPTREIIRIAVDHGTPIRTLDGVEHWPPPVEIEEHVEVPEEPARVTDRTEDALRLTRIVEAIDNELLVHHRWPKRDAIASSLGMWSEDEPSGAFKRAYSDWKQLVQSRMALNGIAMSDLKQT